MDAIYELIAAIGLPVLIHAGELERFLALGLDDRSNEAILRGNAASLLGLE